METFEKQAQLYAALSRAQGQFPPIPRNRTVTVKTKTGGQYKFDYAPLETILDHVRQPLAAEGLAVSQALVSENGHTFLETSLLHANGGALSSKLVLSRAEQLPPQELGSLLTYLRRYSLQALLGIATEEDDDANSASGNTVTRRETRSKSVGESGGVSPSPESVSGAAPQQAPSPSPTERTQALRERWNALSLADAKAKASSLEDADLLRELLVIEGEREQGGRKTVLAAVSRRIKELEPESEGKPQAAMTNDPDNGGAVSQATTEPDAPGSDSEPAFPSDNGTLQELLACLAFIAEAPESVENAQRWTPTNVLVGLSNSGAGAFGTLAEVPDEWLGRVLERVPLEVREMIAKMGPEAKAKLAGA